MEPNFDSTGAYVRGLEDMTLLRVLVMASAALTERRRVASFGPDDASASAMVRAAASELLARSARLGSLPGLLMDAAGIIRDMSPTEFVDNRRIARALLSAGLEFPETAEIPQARMNGSGNAPAPAIAARQTL